MLGMPISILTNSIPHSLLIRDARRFVSRIDKLLESYPVSSKILDSVSLGIGTDFVKCYTSKQSSGEPLLKGLHNLYNVFITFDK